MRLATGLIAAGLLTTLPFTAKAQDVSQRLQQRRYDNAVRQLVAQLPASATGGTQSGTPAAATPAAGTSTDATANAVAAARPRRQITASVDTRYGFDQQTVALGDPAFIALEKRTISTVNLSLSYPVSPSTSVFMSLPYVRQRATYSASFGTLSLRGQGLGDVGLYVQKTFASIGRGTDLSASLGMIFPTGSSPFNSGPNELPTGVGFYQPVARLTLSKLRTPLRFYGALDYGTSLKKSVGGARVDLPDSYGSELGFYYTMSPEFSTQTSVSYSKVTSPFIDVPGTNVGYLSQSLSYQANQKTAFRASVDVGLTEDSTDAFFGLSLDNTFN